MCKCATQYCRRPKHPICWSVVANLVLFAVHFNSVFAINEPQAKEVGPKEILRSHVESLTCIPISGDAKEEFRIAPDALLSYSDPARNYLAGGVWKIGLSGRPHGFVAMELWPDDTNPKAGIVHMELNSFHDQGMELRNTEGVIWRPKEGNLKFLPLDEPALPTATAARRFLQMKQIANRFSVTEVYRGDVSVLRLLPHQIDRYEDEQAGIHDAAMFAFVSGTNPELVVMVENHDAGWRYGLVRLSWAELNVDFDKKRVATFSEMRTAAPNDAYTSHRETVAIPIQQK